MRISKLGGTIIIVFSFDEEQKTILLDLKVRRGRNIYVLQMIDGKVPDNIVVDDVWYNLYANYQEVQTVLDKASIFAPGAVTLGQYIKVKQAAPALQVIALITEQKQAGRGPALVVAPVSLLENWRREFEKFTVGISVFVRHGSNRTGLYTDLLGYDVVVISYNTASSDQSLLKMIDWNLLVVDEAQNIKNPGAQRTKSIKRIPCHTAIAVTGTPFENHMTDLWSLMDFIAPGCFGKLSEFEAEFTDDVDGAAKLEPYLTPLMIRRRVAEVARDLPERIDVPQVLELSEDEVFAYERQREEILESFNGKNATLPMLQKLRMYCTHPSLIDENDYDDPTVCSGKYERLCELLEEINSLNEKAILFTSYNKMFDILQKDIRKRFGVPVMAINGSTPTEERQPIIDCFSAVQGPALLVLNPRAAGAGLNITAASRVIHYNLEWNPSLEDQASARAYRRGQDTGYDFNTAVADIIDNSIAAKAKNIDILLEMDPNGEVFVYVADDGCGMDFEGLKNAMKYGSAERTDKASLGKFGLGLKTASTAFCRSLSVISKGNDLAPRKVQWDLDYIATTGAWNLHQPEITPDELEYLEETSGDSTGTLVVWEKSIVC